jgi:hypothetical protein
MKILWFTHYEKKKGLWQLALQTQFLNCIRHSQSFYLYGVSANGQVAWVAKLQFIIYMMQLITTQLQLCHNN